MTIPFNKQRTRSSNWWNKSVSLCDIISLFSLLSYFCLFLLWPRIHHSYLPWCILKDVLPWTFKRMFILLQLKCQIFLFFPETKSWKDHLRMIWRIINIKQNFKACLRKKKFLFFFFFGMAIPAVYWSSQDRNWLPATAVTTLDLSTHWSRILTPTAPQQVLPHITFHLASQPGRNPKRWTYARDLTQVLGTSQNPVCSLGCHGWVRTRIYQ